VLHRQADQYCKAHAMQVVGYYQANELCDDMELGPFGKTIAEKIRAQCKHATVLLVRAAACARVCPHLFHLGSCLV